MEPTHAGYRSAYVSPGSTNLYLELEAGRFARPILLHRPGACCYGQAQASESHPCADLHLPRAAGRTQAADHTKAGAVQGTPRQAKVGVVYGIKELAAELHPDALGKFEFPLQREVHIDQTG